MKSYQISREGQVLGEFVESQIHEGLQTGYFRPSDWCWSSGMAEWQGVGAVFRQPPPSQQFMPQAVQMQPLQLPPEPGPDPFERAAVNPYAAPRANVVRRTGMAAAKKLAEPATRGSRFKANVIDNLSLLLCFLPSGFLNESADSSGLPGIWIFVGVGAFFLVVIFNCIHIVSNGQTIGKKMTGIRVVRMDDGEKAGFFRIVFLRSAVAQGLLGIIPLWNLIDILFIFGEERRCLHDKIAGTQVIIA